MTQVGTIHLAVVIPTRNRPEDVRRCLESPAAVQYADWEVLLVDQSTDDQTRRIAREMADRLPTDLRIRTSRGWRARNLGVGRTRDRIVFLDDDCTVAPDWLERVAATFTPPRRRRSFLAP
jgi:glycosyltransferase involved in cell wall biosynthesis